MNMHIGLNGLGVKLGGLELALYVGDLYIRVPRVGELAWNQVGFFCNKLHVKAAAGNTPA